MSVRLYLDTKEVSVLEQACGVPAGTKDRYVQFLLDTETDDSFVAYCKCKEDKDLYTWNQFQLFGFGQFDRPDNHNSGSAKGFAGRRLFNSSARGLRMDHEALERIMPLINKHGVCWS